MRNTNDHRRAEKRGQPLPIRPAVKDRLIDEVFDIVEKVDAPDADEDGMIPIRIAQRKGYITKNQMCRVLGVSRRRFDHERYNRRAGRFPQTVGTLAVEGSNSKGKNARLYKRDELIAWVRSHPNLKKHLPKELR